jgi:hypothetical protein
MPTPEPSQGAGALPDPDELIWTGDASPLPFKIPAGSAAVAPRRLGRGRDEVAVSHHVLRHEFIQRYRIAANPFEHTCTRGETPQESGELLRVGWPPWSRTELTDGMLIFGERHKC